MSRFLVISSLVAAGHVGGAVTQFVLQRLGHEVWLLPTVLLSNHPGHAISAGDEVAPDRLAAMLDAIERNGWLGGVDAIFTGYLPSQAHVAFAVQAIKRAKAVNPRLLVCCDPILGDDPKGLYIDAAAASAIRDDLVALADLVTPNRFELCWLAGQGPGDDTDTAALAALARTLGPARILVTSATRVSEEIVTQLIEDGSAITISSTALPEAPHGTGDAIAAMFCGHYLKYRDGERAARAAVAAISDILNASQGHADLRLVATQDQWMQRLAGPGTRSAG